MNLKPKRTVSTSILLLTWLAGSGCKSTESMAEVDAGKAADGGLSRISGSDMSSPIDLRSGTGGAPGKDMSPVTPDTISGAWGSQVPRRIDASNCNTLALVGPRLLTTRIAKLPEFTGGNVADGTYDAVMIQTPEIPGKVVNRFAIELSRGAVKYATEQVVGTFSPDTFNFSGSYSAKGSVLTMTWQCGPVDKLFDYSASGDVLVLYEKDSQNQFLLTFKRRP